MENLNAIPEITGYLTTNTNISMSNKSKVLRDYTNILNFFNIFLTNIPPEQINNDVLSIIRPLILGDQGSEPA